MSSDNNIQTLRTALFAQLERLQDPNCNTEKEIARSNALVAVSGQIVATAKVELDFAKMTGGKGQQSAFLAPGSDTKQLGDADN